MPLVSLHVIPDQLHRGEIGALWESRPSAARLLVLIVTEYTSVLFWLHGLCRCPTEWIHDQSDASLIVLPYGYESVLSIADTINYDHSPVFFCRNAKRFFSDSEMCKVPLLSTSCELMVTAGHSPSFRGS